MSKLELDTLARDNYTDHLPADIEEAVNAFEAADGKKPYGVTHFLADAQALLAVTDERAQINGQEGLSDKERTAKLAYLAEFSNPLFERTLEYAMPIVTHESDAPIEKHPQVLTRIFLDRTITSYSKSQGINTDALHGTVNNLLGAALDLAIFRKSDTPGFDGNRFNKDVSEKLRLQQIPRGGPLPTAAKK